MWQPDTDGDNDNEKMWQRSCYRNKQQWNDAIMLQKHQACDKIEQPNGKKHVFDLNLSLSKMKKEPFSKIAHFWDEFWKKKIENCFGWPSKIVIVKLEVQKQICQNKHEWMQSNKKRLNSILKLNLF